VKPNQARSSCSSRPGKIRWKNHKRSMMKVHIRIVTARIAHSTLPPASKKLRIAT
jgi:hypothetical protein